MMLHCLRVWIQTMMERADYKKLNTPERGAGESRSMNQTGLDYSVFQHVHVRMDREN